MDKMVRRLLFLALSAALLMVLTDLVSADPPKTSSSVPQAEGTAPQGGKPLEYKGGPPATPSGPSQTWVGSDGKQRAAQQRVPWQGGIWTLTWTALYGLAWTTIRRKTQVPVYKTETVTETVQGTRLVRREVQVGVTKGQVKTLVGYKTEVEKRPTGRIREWTEKVVTGYKTLTQKVQTGVQRWTEEVQQGFKKVLGTVQKGVRTITENVTVGHVTKTRTVPVTRTVTETVSVQKPVTESYVAGYRQQWNSKLKKMESVPVMGTKTYMKTEQEQRTKTITEYRTETYTEPVIEKRTRQEPIYGDGIVEVPNMVKVEREEPVYESKEVRVPEEKLITHREPEYEEIKTEVPEYEYRPGLVPVTRPELVEEPYTYTKDTTRQVQIGTKEIEIEERVQQPVFQGWAPSWSFTPDPAPSAPPAAPAPVSPPRPAGDLDQQINAVSAALRKAQETKARLPREDQAEYQQQVIAPLEATLASLNGQKAAAQGQIGAAPAAPAQTPPIGSRAGEEITSAPVSAPAKTPPSAAVVKPVRSEVLPGTASSLEVELARLNGEIDRVSAELRAAQSQISGKHRPDAPAASIAALEIELNNLYEQRTKTIQDAILVDCAKVARESVGEIQLDARLSSIVGLGAQGPAAEVVRDFNDFRKALQDYWGYLLDYPAVPWGVHDKALKLMQDIPAKYGGAFPGQDDWALQRENKAALSRKFRDAVSALWVDRANQNSEIDETALNYWRSRVTAEDRLWETTVNSLNDQVIALKAKRWGILDTLTKPLSHEEAAKVRQELDKIAQEGVILRERGATLPSGWLTWEQAKRQTLTERYQALYRQLQSHLDSNGNNREDGIAKRYDNLLTLLREFIPSAADVDRVLEEEAFALRYPAYWGKVLRTDDSAAAYLQALKERFPGVSLEGAAAKRVEADHIASIEEAYLSARLMLTSTSDRIRDEAERKIQWWRKALPTLTDQWDTEGSQRSLSLPFDALNMLQWNVFQSSGVTTEQLIALIDPKEHPILHKAMKEEGLAAAMVEADRDPQNPVNALFTLARLVHESGWGTASWFAAYHNTGAFMVEQKLMKFGSFVESIQFDRLNLKRLYKDAGYLNIMTIAQRYAPLGVNDGIDETDGSLLNPWWAHNVATQMINFGRQTGLIPSLPDHQGWVIDKNNSAQMKEVQRLVSSVWAEEGDASHTGAWDQKTQAGIAQFQYFNRLPITGIVDKATWDLLVGGGRFEPAPLIRLPGPAGTTTMLGAGYRRLPVSHSAVKGKDWEDKAKVESVAVPTDFWLTLTEELHPPLDNLKVTDHAGTRVSPIEPYPTRAHSGTDYQASTGTDVKSVDSGKIVVATYDPNVYGYYVVVEHHDALGTPFYSLYAHLSDIDDAKKLLASGGFVAKGKTIGLSGGTPDYPPHLHFEMFKAYGPAPGSSEAVPSWNCADFWKVYASSEAFFGAH